MRIKRFKGSEMSEVLAQVKAELGPDALVLSTRKVRGDGGLFGRFGRPAIEVTAGIDRDPAPVEDTTGLPVGGEGLARRETLQASAGLLAPVEAEIARLRQEISRIARVASDQHDLRTELGELRALLADLRGWSGANGERASGLEPGSMGGLAERHRADLRARRRSQGEGGLSEREANRLALLGLLEERLVPARPDDPARARLLVGAPGVGKTTTLAKMAARDEAREERVSLITTDSFRIGAEEQLRIYADLLQLPLDTALSAEDVRSALSRRGARRVYIDTPGRGTRDEAALGDLMSIREALGARGRVELVVEATTQEADLRAQLHRFAPLRPDALIVTKVDESRDLRGLLNVVLDPGTPPLQWVGMGQNVPEDLAVAEPELLCSWLEGEAA